MLRWISEHQVALYWAGAASVALVVAIYFLAPAILVRIPPDYFTHRRRPALWADRGRFQRVALLVAKNSLGYAFLLGGLAMLVLPGPGFLGLLLGFFLVDLPGKYRAEKWIVSRPRILKAINSLRRRRGREPLQAGAATGAGSR